MHPPPSPALANFLIKWNLRQKAAVITLCVLSDGDGGLQKKGKKKRENWRTGKEKYSKRMKERGFKKINAHFNKCTFIFLEGGL